MKRLLPVFFLFISLGINAQIDTAVLKENIKLSMDSVNTAFVTKDWEQLTDFMHPTVIKMIGTREDFISFLREQMKTLEMAKVQRSEVGEILQLVKSGSEWQTVVQAHSQMSIDSMIISSVSSNIGFSSDEGRTWKFIRVSNGSETVIKERFPQISKEIRIPYNKMEFTDLNDMLKNYKLEYTTAIQKSKPSPKIKSPKKTTKKSIKRK